MKTINKFREIEPYLKPNSLILLDLDNTVFRSRTYYGSVQWLKDKIQRLMKKEKLTDNEATLQLYPEWIKSQEDCKIKLCDKELPKLMNKWKEAGHKIVGLTARQPILDQVTQWKQLRSLEIFFDGWWSELIFNTVPFSMFKYGILFCDERNSKGIILSKFLNTSEVKRIFEHDYIIFIDDVEKHLTDVEEVCNNKGIEYQGFKFEEVKKEYVS